MIILRILLAVLFVLVVSPLYKFLCIFFLVCTFRNKVKIPNYAMLLVLVIGIFICTPRYNTGKLRLLYEEKGKLVDPPIIDYVVDCIIPEEEIMNIGVSCFNHCSIFFKNYPNWIVKTAYNNREHLSNFVKPYSDLHNNVMSGVWGQLHNNKTIYLQLPDNKNAKLIVFCHGYAGNWKMYQGVLSKLDNYIILSIGTSNISGIYDNTDISRIFSEYIPYLKERGYTISGINIIGLSNGVTAIDSAIRWFPTKFDSYTTISGNLSYLSTVSGSINFIGGAKDHSSNRMPEQHKQCKKIGVKSTLYFPDDDHFLLVNRPDDVIKTLQNIIQ